MKFTKGEKTRMKRKKLLMLLGVILCGIVVSFYGIRREEAATKDVKHTWEGFGKPKSTTRYEIPLDIAATIQGDSEFYIHNGAFGSVNGDVDRSFCVAYTGHLWMEGNDGKVTHFSGDGEEMVTLTKKVNEQTVQRHVLIQYFKINSFSKDCLNRAEIEIDDGGEAAQKGSDGITKRRKCLGGSIDVGKYDSNVGYYIKAFSTNASEETFNYSDVKRGIDGGDGYKNITSSIQNGRCSFPDDIVGRYFVLFAVDESFGRIAYKAFDCNTYTDFKCPDFSVSDVIKPVASVSGYKYYSETSFPSSQGDTVVSTVKITDNTDISTGVAISDKTGFYLSGSSKKDEKTYSILFGNSQGDTKASVEIEARDIADNVTTYDQVFVYDATAPKIQNITLNNVEYAKSKKIFGSADVKDNGGLLVGFDVAEDNLQKVKVEYVDKTGGLNILSPKIEDMGAISHCTCVIPKESKGKIRIEAEDIVNHKSSYETEDDITIDLTPIEITSVKLNGNSIWKNTGTLYLNDKEYEFLLSADGTDVAEITLKEKNSGKSFSFNKYQTEYRHLLSLDEGVQDFEITTRDLAGNTKVFDASGNVFCPVVVDRTKPVLDAKRDGHKIHFTFTEKYPDADDLGDATFLCRGLHNDITDIDFKINGKEISGSLSLLRSELLKASNWTAAEDREDTYELDLELLTNGTYQYEMSIRDEAGNVSEKIKDRFCFDDKEPDFVSANFDVDKKEYRDYGYIANRTIGLEIVGSDEVSGIKEVVVHYTDNDGNKIDGSCEKKEGTEDTYLYFFGKKKCEKGIIDSITLTDNNGNTRLVEFKNGIIIDKETEEVEMLDLQIADDANGKEVLNKDLSLTMTMKDSYSGIASYEYTLNGKKKAGSGDKQKIEYEKTITDKFIAAENEGDDIAVELSATDNAGNTRSVKKTYSFDTTKPSIRVSYDSKTDNNYYKETRTATVTITDEHFMEKGVVLNVTNNGNKVSITPKFTTSDDKTFTMNIPFSDEGIYTFGVEAEDRAGNKSSYKDNTEFTIDKTAPKLSISYDEARAANDKYFNKTRVANILVDELNFDDSQVHLTISATAGGSAPGLSSFSSSSTHHTASLAFSTDGTYAISGTVTDKAGNVSEEVISPEFIIDTKQPEISFNGVEEGKSYNGDVAPAISVSDTNYDSGTVETSGMKYGKHTELHVSNDKSKEGESFTYASFERKLGTDDAYTIHVTAKDLAGNTQEKSVSFKVNRFGSRYSLDNYTTEAVEKYYVNSDKNFVIIEDNLDKVNNYELCYISDGATKVLDAKDYSVSSSSDASGWNTYSYSIKPDMLEKDGVYSFVVYSTDAAGNKSDNITKGTPLKVCVDDTVPVITVTNLEDTGVYRVKEMKAHVSITDNIAYDNAVVKLNDKEYEKTDPEFDIDLSESKKEQTLEVVASDKAGNIVTTDVYTFLIDSSASENAKVESRREKKKSSSVGMIVIYCALGIVLIGAAATVILVAKKRKKDKDVNEE